MRIRRRGILALSAALSIGVLGVAMTSFAASAAGTAQHVRWDIIHLAETTPPTITAGGVASASAANGGDTITLTGSGNFVAPANGRGSGNVTGGGTWTTSGDGQSGTYKVTRMVIFQFANFQLPVLNDQLSFAGTAANGSAVLRVRFSDGSKGVLTVGCHGPGAPPGIFEGIAITKGFVTYYAVQPPTAGVDANRTVFHVRQGGDEDEEESD
jgi:hypothetical protein